MRSTVLAMSLLTATGGEALALPTAPTVAPGNPVILVQHAPVRTLEPLTADEIAAIAKAIAAQPDHPFPAEDAATADGRKLLDKQDFLGAHDAFVGLAMKGNAAAIYMLGVMYTGGRGVKQDFPAAAKLFLICGEANSPFCQNALIDIYQTGKGVPRDPVLAQKWQDRYHKNPYVTTTTIKP